MCEVLSKWGRLNWATSPLLPELRFPHNTFVMKEQYSSFYASTLDATLRAAGVDTIYLTGILTNVCVFATALDAWYRGYKVFVVTDAVTSWAEEAHTEGLNMMDNFFFYGG